MCLFKLIAVFWLFFYTNLQVFGVSQKDEISSSSKSTESKPVSTTSKTNNHDDYSSSEDTSSSSSKSKSCSESAEVLAETKQKVKSEANPYRSEALASVKAKYEIKLETSSCTTKFTTHESITEPQVYTPRGEWKSITVGPRPLVKSPPVLGPQPWPEIAPNPVIEARLKVTSATNEAENVIRTLREYNSLQTDTEKLLELEELTIKNSTLLNEHLQKTLYDIQQVLYEPDGWIQSGSGKFVGINSSKDVATINKHIDRFEREVHFWKHDRTDITEDIIHDHAKRSPKFLPAQPYNQKWHDKIKNEQYNLDLKIVSKAQNNQELEQAQQIVAKYEQQIPRTQDGWLKAGSENNRFCTINRMYEKNVSKQQAIVHAQSQAKNSLVKQDSLVTQEVLSTTQKEEIATALKILSRPSDFNELSSERLISSDFIITLKDAESRATYEYDLKIFDEIIKDPELGPLLRQALNKEKEAWILPHKFPGTLQEQCDDLLQDWIDRYKEVQQAYLTDSNAFKKYAVLWATELNVKTIGLGQAALHPIETVENMAHGLKNMAKIVGRLNEIDFYLERNDLETARQKSNQLSDEIDVVLNNFNNLPREEKFKVAVGLLYDLLVTPKLVDKSFALAGRLKTIAQEVKAAQKANQFAVEEGLQKIERFREICEKRAEDLAKATQKAQTVVNYTEQALLLNNKISEVTSIEQVINDLRAIFDKTRKGFAEFSNKYIKVPYKHILVPEISATKNGLKLTGFHHDYLNVLENSGIVKITNKIMGKHGIYKADVWLDGKLFKDKTFFPPDWTRQKIISKIYETYDDFISKGAMGKLTKDGKYIIRGTTSEGIEIEMYITKSAQITTAYPVL
jgi:hypothetical protein